MEANTINPDQTAPLQYRLVKKQMREQMTITVIFVCFDCLHPSQQFFSHVRMGLPWLNQC